jgi:hypothetical protein
MPVDEINRLCQTADVEAEDANRRQERAMNRAFELRQRAVDAVPQHHMALSTLGTRDPDALPMERAWATRRASR